MAQKFRVLSVLLTVSLCFLGLIRQAQPADLSLTLSLGHATSGIRDFVFSPTGRLLASADQDSVLILWDVESGRELRRFNGHKHLIEGLAFSADEKSLLSAGYDKTIHLWEVATGREVKRWNIPEGIPGAVAFSPDGKYFAVNTNDGTLRVYDVQQEGPVRQFLGTRGDTGSVSFSPSGARILTGFGNTIFVWGVQSERPLLRRDVDAQVQYTAFKDEDRILTIDHGGYLRTTDIPSGNELSNFWGVQQDGRVIAGGVSSTSIDGDLAFIEAKNDKGGYLVETASYRILSKVPPIDDDWLFRTRFHQTSRLIAARTRNGNSIYIIDGNTGKTIRSLGDSFFSKRASLGAAKDDQIVVTRKSSIFLWDIKDGKGLGKFKSRGDLNHSAVYLPKQNSLAVAYGNGSRLTPGADERPNGKPTIEIFDLPSQQKQLELRTSDLSYTYGIRTSGDGRYLLAVGIHAELWDLTTQKKHTSYSDDENDFRSYSISPSGRQVLLGFERRLEVFDAITGRKIKSVADLKGNVYEVGFSHDGRIAFGVDAASLIVWDASTWREKWRKPLRFARHAAFSSDDSMLSVTTGDDRIVVIDARSGREIKAFPTIGGTSHVLFSRSGELIITADRDGTISLWDTRSGERQAVMISAEDGEWLTITSEGFFDASSPRAAKILSAVQGIEVSSIDQLYDTLYRPDLVREKLAGDRNGKVKSAAATMDLGRVMASGSPPVVKIVSPEQTLETTSADANINAIITDRGGGIGKVEWRVNGVTVGVEAPRGVRIKEAASSSARVLTVERRISLLSGENKVELVAYNEKNLIASEPALANLVLKQGSEVPAKLHVLAVGINDYYEGRLKLTYAVPDASALSDALMKAGKNLFADVRARTVLDSEATTQNLDKVFSEFAAQIGPQDVFVFFLAGHGKTKNGRYYFLPRDFRYEDETSIEKQGIGQNRLQEWLARVPARKSILLYDTCESGSLTAGNSRGFDLDERLGALSRMARATGRTFLTATTDDAPALEGYRGHGVFTYAILDAFDRADINGDGLIQVSELADYVDAKVPDISFEAFKLRQTPQRSMIGNNFALANRIAALSNEREGLRAIDPAHLKPTHVVTTAAQVFDKPGGDGHPVEVLTPGALVSVTNTEDEWHLVFRDGKRLGFVSKRNIAATH